MAPREDPQRTERLLVVDGGVRSAIALVLAVERWLRAGGDPAAAVLAPSDYSVRSDAILACEDAVGARLSDDTLALLACHADAVADRWRAELGSVGSHTERARERGLPRSLIAIGNDGHLWLAVPKRGAAGDHRELSEFDDTDRSVQRIGAVRWLHRQVEQALDDVLVDDPVREALESEANAERFAPRIAPGQATPAGSRVARVRHPKWGEGTVLRDVGDGEARRLEVRFDDGSTRTLLARFVEPLPG